MFKCGKQVWVGKGARSQGPDVACRFTRSDKGDGVMVRRGAVRSVFLSVSFGRETKEKRRGAGRSHRQARQ